MTRTLSSWTTETESKMAATAMPGGDTQSPRALSVAQQTDKPSTKKSIFEIQIGVRITQRDVLGVTRQLAVMVKAGISITEALSSMAEQTKNVKLQKLLTELHADVEAGKPFSEAIAAHPKVFSTLYINMIHASELTGSFSHILSRIAEYLSHQIETRNQVRAALIYPVILGIMALGTTVFMLVFVLPKFVLLFQGKEDMLPLPTKILLGLSASMVAYWYLYLISAIGLVTGLVLFLKTDNGKFVFDTVKLRVPIFKKLFHCLYLSRGLRTMGELVNSGVPMLETLSVTGEVSGNAHYKSLWAETRDAVSEGRTISDTLLKSNLMPRGVTQMIAAGEQSGNLSDVLRDISEFYDRELKAVIKSSTAMLEPMMIVAMGGVVGFVASSILLPIFQLSKIMK
jgi:type IV pilus assembly protein PilC